MQEPPGCSERTPVASDYRIWGGFNCFAVSSGASGSVLAADVIARSSAALGMAMAGHLDAFDIGQRDTMLRLVFRVLERIALDSHSLIATLKVIVKRRRPERQKG